MNTTFDIARKQTKIMGLIYPFGNKGFSDYALVVMQNSSLFYNLLQDSYE